MEIEDAIHTAILTLKEVIAFSFAFVVLGSALLVSISRDTQTHYSMWDRLGRLILFLFQGFEGELTEENMELGVATEEGFRILTQQEVKEYILEVE